MMRTVLQRRRKFEHDIETYLRRMETHYESMLRMARVAARHADAAAAATTPAGVSRVHLARALAAAEKVREADAVVSETALWMSEVVLQDKRTVPSTDASRAWVAGRLQMADQLVTSAHMVSTQLADVVQRAAERVRRLSAAAAAEEGFHFNSPNA